MNAMRRYFVPPLLDDEPVELGDDGLGLVLVDELLSVEVEPELDDDGGVVAEGGVAVDGAGADGGEADGVRSPGRSPTRSVLVSLQAVSRPRPSATAKTAVRNFFISTPSSCWVARPLGESATAMPPPRGLTG